jgi:hypothetical protein
MKNRHRLKLVMDSLVSRGIADAEITLEEDEDIYLERDDPGFGFDKRTVDIDGRMHVPDCTLSVSKVSPYFGREIPNYEALGLQADSIYHLYRDADALDAAAKSTTSVPLMMHHVASTADQPNKPYIVGSVSNVRYRHDTGHLVGDLSIWDAEAIKVIEDESQRELSAGYRYQPQMEAGWTDDGESYEGSMLDIALNHVALVAEGRVGPDAHVRE